MSLKKVFIGNLDYDTKEADLIDAFKSVGKVVSANVVRKGYRSKGYGFVEFESPEEARKAVEEFDNTDLHNRTINVQVSNSENSDRPPRRNSDNQGGRRSFRNDDRDNFRRAFENRQGNNRRFFNLRRPSSDEDDRDFERPIRKRNQRGPPRRRFDDDDDSGDRNVRRGNDRRGNNDDNYRRQSRPNQGGNRRRPPQRRNNNRNNNRNRPEKPPRKEVEKVESKTTIFVANLPFSVGDEELVDLFKKCGSIKTAHVVTNRGKSKGFGFVEFENQEGQKKAIEDMENYSVPGRGGEDRNLAVKVAMAPVEEPDEELVPVEENEKSE